MDTGAHVRDGSTAAVRHLSTRCSTHCRRAHTLTNTLASAGSRCEQRRAGGREQRAGTEAVGGASVRASAAKRASMKACSHRFGIEKSVAPRISQKPIWNIIMRGLATVLRRAPKMAVVERGRPAPLAAYAAPRHHP